MGHRVAYNLGMQWRSELLDYSIRIGEEFVYKIACCPLLGDYI